MSIIDDFSYAAWRGATECGEPHGQGIRLGCPPSGLVLGREPATRSKRPGRHAGSGQRPVSSGHPLCWGFFTTANVSPFTISYADPTDVRLTRYDSGGGRP